MKKLNIVIVSTLYPNTADPARGVFTAQMVKKLKNLCNVIVISPLPWFPKNSFLNSINLFKKWNIFSKVSDDTIDGVQVYYPRYIVIPGILSYSHSFFMSVPLFFCIRRLNKQRKIDLINTHWVFPDGVASTIISKILKIPNILVALGCDITHFPALSFRKKQITWALKNSASLMAVSEDLGQRMIKLGAGPSKIKLAPDGVDFGKFHVVDRILCREKLGLPQDKKIILQVASLDEVKGGKYLIRAVSLLKESEKNVCVYFVGDGHLKHLLIKQSKELGVEKIISFVGRIPHDEIPLWMNSADTFCLSSIREGRPNVLLESIACGVPVVATAVGGVPEIINPDNGYLAESTNAQDIADKLYKVLNREWIRESISSTVSHLTWETAADIYFSEYLSVLNQ